MKVLLSPQAEDYLYDLIEILYQKEYFSFYDSADEYVTSLMDEIVLTIGNKPKRIAPAHFAKYGNNLRYAVFKKNENTQWYVFFNFENDVYLIRYIGNNHTCAQYL